MPISVCQESIQDVFNHAVQVVTRQRHISVFQGLFVKHLHLHLKHLLSPEEVFFAGLRGSYLKNCSFFPVCPCMLFLSPVPPPHAIPSSTAQVLLCGGRDILVLGDSLAMPYRKAGWHPHDTETGEISIVKGSAGCLELPWPSSADLQSCRWACKTRTPLKSF